MGKSHHLEMISNVELETMRAGTPLPPHRTLAEPGLTPGCRNPRRAREAGNLPRGRKGAIGTFLLAKCLGPGFGDIIPSWGLGCLEGYHSDPPGASSGEDRHRMGEDPGPAPVPPSRWRERGFPQLRSPAVGPGLTPPLWDPHRAPFPAQEQTPLGLVHPQLMIHDLRGPVSFHPKGHRNQVWSEKAR